MPKSKILITGAGGFVGRNLAEYLPALGYDVHAFTHKALDLLDEAAVADTLAALNPEVIVHCATVGGTRKTGYDAGATDVVSKNLRMFFNLTRALKPGMRMINLGSGAEYDKRFAIPKISETEFDKHVPVDDYGYAKYVISKYIEKTGDITCLRVFGLFGRYEDCRFKFISNAIVKNLLGLPIIINQNAVFDYLCVEDFCALIAGILKVKPSYAHYNITPTESIDLVSLAKLVNDASEKPSEIKVVTPGFNLEYTGSNKRILAELDGFNFTAYGQSVKQLYAYYAVRLGELDLEAVKKDPFLKSCRTNNL